MVAVRQGNRGVILIEWLVAIVIALVVLGGGFHIYQRVNASYVELKELNDLELRAQSALALLVRSFERSGYFGNQTAAITQQLPSDPQCRLPGRPSDEAADFYAVRHQQGQQLSCLETKRHPLVTDSDVIELKGSSEDVQESHLPSLHDGFVYAAPGGHAGVDEQQLAFHHQWFFLVNGDHGPALQMFYRNRQGVVGNNSGVLIDGIRMLRLHLAVCHAGSVLWKSSEQMSAADWQQLMAVDIGVLARSAKPRPDVDSPLEYTLAGESISLPAAERYYHHVSVEQVVWLSTIALQSNCARPMK